MADNFAVFDATGTSRTVGTKDLSNVHLTKHIIVDDNGDIALVSVANAALAENAAKFLQTASVAFALDDAASAGSQAVPLEVESTAAPNLKAVLMNGTAKIFDAAARPGYVRITDGTNNMPSGDAVARPVYVTPVAATGGGATVHNTNGLVNTAVAVKASAGTLCAVTVTNTHSATQYVQIWNTAQGSVVVGSTAPIITIAVPATSTVHIDYALGLAFGTAITIAATTTATGGTGATSSTMNVVVAYK